MNPRCSEYSRNVLLKTGAYRSDFTTAALKLSTITLLVTPPKNCHASSMPEMRTGRSWVRETATYWWRLKTRVTTRA